MAKKRKKPIKKKKPLKKRGPKPKPPKKEKYAYTITDVAFEDFNVLNSDNAWWLDSLKMQKLIDAFKIGAPISEAKVYAGISEEQWNYFKNKHPKFYAIKKACQELPNLQARKRVVEDIEKSTPVAQWWLTKKKPKEFGDVIKFAGRVRVDLSDEANKRAKKYD
ncbi:MAG TPA: hypothetical protein ENI08_02285 [Candidatus Dependentiae bacterium]|nr:hypothetical protein [Candidatus Dependentiae bacterium]